jgi:hypothetical protein
MVHQSGMQVLGQTSLRLYLDLADVRRCLLSMTYLEVQSDVHPVTKNRSKYFVSIYK